MRSGIDIERDRPFTETTQPPEAGRATLTGPLATLLTCLVFGVFCLIVTSTMGGTAEYVKGMRFAIGFGMFGVFFATTITRAALEAWSLRRHTR